VQSGKGGDGCVSFRREKYVPKGGPDGGDGGDGGDVYLIADTDTDTLQALAGRHHWNAQDGEPGQSRQKHGSDGEDCPIPVPPGTLVYDETEGENKGELLGDLDKPGQRLIVARGGRGGLGNEHFKSATNQTPREASPGEPAVERTLRLELKLMADIGLVGFPNAGKSTLLSRISAARPRIADYPFTTLQPQLGIAELSDQRRLTFADIPGLIEGASQGQGLGHEFLRHVERTGALLHVVDIAPVDQSDPVANLQQINRELAEYAVPLDDKPQVVAANKIDLVPDAGQREEVIEKLRAATDAPVVPISAATGEGLPAMLEACWTVSGRQRPTEWTEA
ncbi:MAG: GTPase ObgE, partial [Phycisphaeraceae bacterium]|nr:GTPase ObgE [Phycisphaeraceae bacterium]